MSNPIFSIIMPVYNSKEFVELAIRSVRVQTFTNWEMIIVDDCSTDGSLEIIKKLARQDSRIRVIELDSNSGAAGARNAAIAASNGRYIAFLDSDDLWLPEKLQLQLDAIQASDAAICFTSYCKMLENGTRTERVVVAKTLVNFKMLLKSNHIGLSTAIFDTHKCGKVFMINTKMHEDYGLWLNILGKGNIAIGLKDALVCYRVRKNSLSGNKLKAAFYHWKVLRASVKINNVYAIFLFVNYAYNGYLKHRI